MHEEHDELEDKSVEYKTGFRTGMLIAGVVVACILAIIITATLKVMKWIWWL